MDDTDLQILKILQKKARVPNVEVARKIGMAPSAVLERIKKLEAQGVIEGYEVRLNPNMFHGSMIAFIQIKVAFPNQLIKIGEKLSKIEQIQEVHFLAGEDCLMVKLRVSDNCELETILRTRIASLDIVKETKTFIALSTFKESAKIMLPKTLE
ncbi:MAG: Lrp/AsnC family transcriptional regulator [Desulfobacula sp.]|uniref:Lrp/AsnC family transcriptional regulator n=1 Tax=Desulfobacula sp. TaxID=2593537 RepID=UPI001D7B8BED|nr:Lrp/AsnC family transcriptional regulator [Desulfobacula sp.]MBT3485004.1 Lrp/AsnC family transcriptional regulator [Desulfobacula sp.]MBT3804179.1 Lrp/AsnC family transcriptional regulator [Desulfobacula sp.]MBT4025035.1 Lrp/AsnC family transcriptional regulator [Desulfobacula sp.]MBT4198655.1 Lrp/AsnC family transcriptional regulator [Desulfobacula sp.]